MKRRALVVSAIAAAAVISIFIGASLWWNRHASNASLRALAGRQIKHNLQRDFAAVDLKSIELRDFQIARAGSTAHFSGTALIPRGRFAVGWWQNPSTFIYFQPQGSAELAFEGRADIQRQHVSAWRSLGPVRPVWVPWQIWTTANQALFDEAWDRSLTTGPDALFDALADAIDMLVDHLIDALEQGHLAEIRAARNACREYAPGYGLHGIDLGLLCEEMAGQVGHEGVRMAAESVGQELRNVVLASYAGLTRRRGFGSNGLSIYFPRTRALFDSDPDGDGYRQDNADYPVEFVQNRRWPAFLSAYYQHVV